LAGHGRNETGSCRARARVGPTGGGIAPSCPPARKNCCPLQQRAVTARQTVLESADRCRNGYRSCAVGSLDGKSFLGFFRFGRNEPAANHATVNRGGKSQTDRCATESDRKAPGHVGPNPGARPAGQAETAYHSRIRLRGQGHHGVFLQTSGGIARQQEISSPPLEWREPGEILPAISA
jgi:hypothetical protein